MEERLKILSWNINGLRASKSHFQNLIQSQSCDIVCFQETKLTRDQLDEETAVLDGYNSYYSFSRKRGGYSGVATICKDTCTPIGAEEGLSCNLKSKLNNNKDGVGHYGSYEEFTPDEINALDSEGRALITQHKIRLPNGVEELLAIINVYCPRADCENEDRQRFKIRFYELLQLRANAILQSGSYVIIVGDINTSHKPIDTCRALAGQELPNTDGRKWLDKFLSLPSMDNANDITENKKGNYFVDTFRHFYPDQKDAYTCWCTKTGARQTNFGTRLDYIFADNSLVDAAFVDSIILPEIEGSDHCPIVGELRCQSVAAAKAPSLCTKFYPEFAGKQQKLVSFLSRRILKTENKTDPQMPPRKKQCTEAPSKTKKLTKQITQQKLTSFFNQPKVTLLTTESNSESLPLLSNSSEKVDHIEGLNDNGCDSKTGSVNSSQEDHVNSVEVSTTNKVSNAAVLWKNVFQAPQAPKCKGHKESCILRTVKKPGPNCGRQFYVCARPEGLPSNPEARCDFFAWKSKT